MPDSGAAFGPGRRAIPLLLPRPAGGSDGSLPNGGRRPGLLFPQVLKRSATVTAEAGCLKFLALLVACVAFLAAACSGDSGPGSAASRATSASGAAPSAVPVLENASNASTTPPAGLEAQLRAALAARLSVAPTDVSVRSITPQTWPDSCLGLASPGVICAQALVPGWLAIVVGPDGREYRYRIGGGQVIAAP